MNLTSLTAPLPKSGDCRSSLTDPPSGTSEGISLDFAELLDSRTARLSSVMAEPVPLRQNQMELPTSTLIAAIPDDQGDALKAQAMPSTSGKQAASDMPDRNLATPVVQEPTHRNKQATGGDETPKAPIKPLRANSPQQDPKSVPPRSIRAIELTGRVKASQTSVRAIAHTAITDVEADIPDMFNPREVTQRKAAPRALAFLEVNLLGKAEAFAAEPIQSAPQSLADTAFAIPPVSIDERPQIRRYEDQRLPAPVIAHDSSDALETSISSLPELPPASGDSLSPELIDHGRRLEAPRAAVDISPSGMRPNVQSAPTPDKPHPPARMMPVPQNDGFDATTADEPAIPEADDASEAANRTAARHDSRRAALLSQLAPVSVTLHSASQGVSVTARIAGSDREQQFEIERIVADAFAEHGLSLSGLTLNGQPVEGNTRS